MSPFTLRVGQKVVFEDKSARAFGVDPANGELGMHSRKRAGVVTAVYRIPFYGLAYVRWDDTESENLVRTKFLVKV